MTGLCQCGCGQPAPISKENDSRRGRVKGQPLRFIRGHNMRGTPRSPAWRAKMSAVMRGKKHSPETRARISEVQRGRKASPETRAKMSASRLGVFAHEKNPAWRGDDATYSSVHHWLRRNYPKAGVCESCGVEGPTDYAYLGEPGGYARDRSMYEEVCPPCHQSQPGHGDYGRRAAA